MKFSNLKDLGNGIVEVEVHFVPEDETPEQKLEENGDLTNSDNTALSGEIDKKVGEKP